jgi:GNAT superfamily N-acetyltransferase
VDGETVGYFVLTIAFSLEFGGKFGLLDELFIRDEYTGRGIGTATMKFVEQQCREISAATLRLEVGIQNPDARRFYERHGMRREARHLMTKRLT